MAKIYGFLSLDTNLIMMPVWCCVVLFIVTFGIASDQMKKRGWFAIASFPIASMG